MRFVVLAVLVIGLVAAPGATAGQMPTNQVQVVVENANVRSGPSTTCPVLALAPRGSLLPILATDGQWYEVDFPKNSGTTPGVGFVHTSLVVPHVERDQAVTALDTASRRRRTAPEPASPRPGRSDRTPRPATPSTVPSDSSDESSDRTSKGWRPRIGLQIAWGDSRGLGVGVSGVITTLWYPDLSIRASFGYFQQVVERNSGVARDGNSTEFSSLSEEVRHSVVNVLATHDFTISEDPSTAFYLGGGLNVVRRGFEVVETRLTFNAFGQLVDRETVDADQFERDPSTSFGVALAGGARFEVGPFFPFVELRIELSGAEQAVIAGGVLF